MLIIRRRRKVKTTFSGHRLRKYPNLTRELIVDRPNQLWVADITYWPTQYGCLYISLVTDTYSKRIMAGPFVRLLCSLNAGRRSL